MNREVLLIEPNYKNKYPPIGLMKIATYYKLLGDNVTFFKGNIQDLILNRIYDSILPYLYTHKNDVYWETKKDKIIQYLKKPNKELLSELSYSNKILQEFFEYHSKYYKQKKYIDYIKKWDIVGITTLFTFYWDITIKTINDAKMLCNDIKNVKVGGILATLLPKQLEEETGITPIIGVLDKAGMLGDNNNYIVDSLPLDYSILNEIDYEYPASNAYYGYMTRGCVNKCKFCVVPLLEPTYINHIPLKESIIDSSNKYGEKKDLLLLDNNILASNKFNEIIDEIKSTGFYKGSTYTEPNMYEISINNLKLGINDKAYIRSIVKLYITLLKSNDKNNEMHDIYSKLTEYNLLQFHTAKKDHIFEIHEIIKPYFEKFYKRKRPKERYVDFNQGIDARKINDDNMKKLAEIPIRPVRIAFDHWSQRDIYEKAVRTAVKYGHKYLSNYILYNYNDTPSDLYNRLKLNVDLCEELGASIYSFPMKYHPIQEEPFFRNRDYIGPHWNRKFIRAIQAILNSTKGKVGRGSSFFYKAFGRNLDEFKKLLYMPETLIIYRLYYENNGITNLWWNSFSSLHKEQLDIIKPIIEKNNFNDINISDNKIKHVLSFYNIKRGDAIV